MSEHRLSDEFKFGVYCIRTPAPFAVCVCVCVCVCVENMLFSNFGCKDTTFFSIMQEKIVLFSPKHDFFSLEFSVLCRKGAINFVFLAFRDAENYPTAADLVLPERLEQRGVMTLAVSRRFFG